MFNLPLCHLVLRKQGKQKLVGCSVPKSLPSRPTLRSHCVLVGRRLYVLAIYIFFAIFSVCPLLVSYQTNSHLIYSPPFDMFKKIFSYHLLKETDLHCRSHRSDTLSTNLMPICLHRDYSRSPLVSFKKAILIKNFKSHLLCKDMEKN